MEADSCLSLVHVHFPSVPGKLSRDCLIGTTVPLLKLCKKIVVAKSSMQTMIIRIYDSMADLADSREQRAWS